MKKHQSFKIKYEPRKNYYFTLLLFSKYDHLVDFAAEKEILSEHEAEIKDYFALADYSTCGNRLGMILMYKGKMDLGTLHHETTHLKNFYCERMRIFKEEYSVSVGEYVYVQAAHRLGIKKCDLRLAAREFGIASEGYNF